MTTSANLAKLVAVRPRWVEELQKYLDALAARCAELPEYYPEHLTPEPGRTAFDDLRQTVQIVEDRVAFERWLAEERERRRAAGQETDQQVYAIRGLPEEEDDERRLREREGHAPPPPVPWDESAAERFQRAVILGDPGFGKTWLLRYEARRLARIALGGLQEHKAHLDDIVLPVFLRLSDLNRPRGDAKKALVRLIGDKRSRNFRRLVQRKIETARCVVLLDAWDEVPGGREDLKNRLRELSVSFGNLRILLTSRIVGYDCVQPPIPGAKELELLAFNEPEIGSFAGIWFADPEKANRFLAMIRGNHQLRGLARIPLMLSLMCRAYDQREEDGKPFPKRRVELYELCLHGLLLDWPRYDGKTPPAPLRIDLDKKASEPLAKQFLLVVAAELSGEGRETLDESVLLQGMELRLGELKPGHELYGRRAGDLVTQLKEDGVLVVAQADPGYISAMLEMLGDAALTFFAEGEEEFKELTLKKKLSAWLEGRKTGQELRGRTATDLIRELKQRGIFIAVNDEEHPPLLFLHRTFQEYLAAGAIAAAINDPERGWDSKLKLSGKEWTVHLLVDKKAWDPAWEEIIILLAGQLDDPVPLLKMLSDPEPTPTNPTGDDIFRHRLCLAARCLPGLPSEEE